MRSVLPAVQRCTVTLACVLSSASALHASGRDEGGPLTLACRTYGADDGLAKANIHALAQSNDGYLWIGGLKGLVRFDGVQFVTWGTRGEPPLPHTEISNLFTDRDGGIWVGFFSGNALSRVVNGKVRTYTIADGLPQGVVAPRAQDRHGTVWAVGAGGIAAFRDGRWEQRQGVNGLPVATGIDARVDHLGALWISTESGIFRRDKEEDQFQLVDPNPASSLAEDPNGVLWAINTQQGIRRLETGQPDAPIQRPAVHLTGQYMVSDRRGGLWVGSPYRTGLLHASVDSRTQRIATTALADDRGIIDKLVLDLLEDREGNVWAGTNGGLVRCYARTIRTYSRANGLPDSNVRAIEVTSDGALWFGTASGLAMLNPDGIIKPSRVPNVDGRAVTSLHGDSGGRLWIGFADSGLGILDKDHFSAIKTPGNTSADNVVTVRPDLDDGLWVCNLRDQGLYYRRGRSTFTKVDTLTASRSGCSATLVDEDGRVWIGFDDGTLLVQERGGHRKVLRGDEGVRGRVCAIYQDRDQTVWVATTEGLSRYRDGRFSTITARNGLPGSYISAVVEDETGNLWVAADAGILRLTKQEFDRTVNDPAHRVLYAMYDQSDGVTDTPICRGEPRAIRDHQGRLWFTSVSSAIAIDPRRAPQQSMTLSPQVERMIADGVVRTGTPISLPARTANIEVHYTAVSLSAGPKVRFHYRLREFDSSWIDAGTRRQAFYTNLPPQHYRFEVRASIDDVMGPATSYEFDIEPALYQRRSFYAGISVVAALCMFGAWQLRVRTLRKQYTLIMSERTRIGREIHDTVFQEMAGVALEIDAVARQGQLPGPQLSNALSHISDEIKDHIEEARETIFELRTPEEGRTSLAESLREAGERILGGTHTHFEVTATGSVRAYGIDIERELVRIVREALRNAARHANAAHVRVGLHYDTNALRLVVTDDGSGFQVEQMSGKTKHWGLVGMRERASRIGAQFTIQSAPGSGTAIEVVVRYAHPAQAQ